MRVLWQKGKRRKWSNHRTHTRVDKNVGIVSVPMPEGSSFMFRNERLEVLDAYYESRQYEHLAPWYESNRGGSFVPVRERAPRINANFTKLMAQRLASKLVGRKGAED